MVNLDNFNPNNVSNPNNNIFGLPVTEDEAELVLLPVPWEVTVSYGGGTSRAPDAIFRASMQVDLYDPEFHEAWKKGFYMRPSDKKILMKSDYLRKEAELYIDYISKGEDLQANHFMCKTLREVNEGGAFLNEWVYMETKTLLDKGKQVGLIGGDHSTPLGFMKAIGETFGSYGILQIDAHFDLRESYEGFKYSHASIMYNAVKEVSQIHNIVQVGVRDFGSDEWDYVKNSNYKVITYFDKEIKNRIYEGQTWKYIAEEIITKLPQKVYISFDIDGLDRKLCPYTGTPVPGGFELEQVFYLLTKLYESGKQIIGFDLSEVGIGINNEWDANVGARVLYKLCNMLASSKAK